MTPVAAAQAVTTLSTRGAGAGETVRRPAYSSVTHYPALDVLRGGAAGMVFLFHAGIPGPAVELATGLRVFFVLSGFVIYLPFVRARLAGQRISIAAYLTRRAFRIYPAYLLAAFGVTLLAGGTPVLDPWTLAIVGWWPVLVMWTLAVEVQFYALVPALDRVVGWLGRGERDRSIAVIATIGVLSLLYVAAVVTIDTRAGAVSTDHLVYANALGYLWAFALGMAIAEFAARQRQGVQARVATPIGLLGIVLIGAGSIVQFDQLDVLTVGGAGCLIVALLGVRLDRRAASVAAGIGAVSYSFYLWHGWVIGTTDAPAPITFALSVAIAALIYLVVERPAIVLGRTLALRVVEAPDAKLRSGAAVHE